jgi:phospholipase C
VDAYGYGFRSPGLLVSPYAKRGHVDHTTLDFTSELKFIENNWGVQSLAERDANANDITTAFDFSSPARAPVLLDRSRTTPAVPDTRTNAVYVSYGAAALLLVVFVAIGLTRQRRLSEGVRA